MTPEFMSVKDTAARLGVHPNTVRNWVRDGVLRSARVPGTREHRFAASEVERVAASRGRPADAAALIGRALSPVLATPEDLESWATRPVAASEFPRIVRYILASLTGLSRVRMPSGTGVSKHGWDGTAVSDGSGLLPAGEVFIEVSVNGNPATKAKSDFEKRAAAVKGAGGVGGGIFLFVTAHRWRGGDAWARKAKAAGAFAHVVVLDPDDLAAALDRDHAVRYWVSEQIGLNPSGAESLATWWDRFRAQTNPELPAQLFRSGRESAVERLSEALVAATPSDRRAVVRAAWVDEALAFVHAVLVDTATNPAGGGEAAEADDLDRGMDGRLADENVEDLSSVANVEGPSVAARALVVSDAAVWARAASSPMPSVLIANVRDGSAFDIDLALRNGHKVIEIGDASTYAGRGQDETTLPRLAVAQASDALIAAGFPRAEATELARLARRSMHALIRNQARSPLREHSPWARDADASAMLGTLALVGSWTVEPADIAVVQSITNRPWDDNERLIHHWADTQDPPFVTTGKSWFPTAHEDALLQLLKNVPSSAIDRYRDAMVEIFVKAPPPQAPTLESIVKSNDRPPHTSPLLRAGLMQTLILLGVHRHLLQNHNDYVAAWCVRELMKAAFGDPSGERLAVIAPFFPSLAEAAPETFLNALEDALDDQPNLIRALFAEDDGDGGPFARSSHHTHLLWALETLAWSRDYFDQAIGALTRLAEIDPGGRLGNRPDRSLKELLVPWASHTAASTAERASALRTMAARSPAVAWKVLIGIWPSNHATSMVPRQPEFRDWAPGNQTVTLVELVRRMEVLATLAPELAGTDASRWAELVDRIHLMPPEIAEDLRTQLSEAAAAMTDLGDQRLLRRRLEEVVDQHEQFAYTDWAMPEDARAQLAHIAEILPADEPELEYASLFDWAVERRAAQARHKAAKAADSDVDYDASDELITGQQLWEERKAAGAVIAAYNNDQLTRLAQQVKVPQMLGRAMGAVAAAPNVDPMLAWLQETGPLFEVAAGWVREWSMTATADDLRMLLAKPQLVGEDNPGRLRLLTSCTATHALAEVLKASRSDYDLFWRNIHPKWLASGSPLEPVVHLVRAQRPWAAMEVLNMELHGPMTEDRAVELAAMARSILDAFFDHENPAADKPYSSPTYELSQLLDHLAKWDPEAPLATYEFAFHRILHFDRRPTTLFKLLASSPQEYISLFNTAFAQPSEDENTSDTTAARHNAWSVLDDFDRIPGTHDDGTIDEEALRTWVRTVRDAHAGSDKEALGDEMIGRILASTVGRDKHTMPPPEVSKVFGEYGNNRMATGFIVARINSVGVTARGANDGGDQERSLAAKYSDLSVKSRAEWPRMSRALRAVADDLDRSAQRMDEEAERRGFGV